MRSFPDHSKLAIAPLRDDAIRLTGIEPATYGLGNRKGESVKDDSNDLRRPAICLGGLLGAFGSEITRIGARGRAVGEPARGGQGGHRGNGPDDEEVNHSLTR